MLITNVRAHHIRIPYDAGVASFKQGASAISALEIVLVEVSTDAGVTGWGDAFAYVFPRSTATAIDEMIAPQARGLEVADAADIPAFMDRLYRDQAARDEGASSIRRTACHRREHSADGRHELSLDGSAGHRIRA